MKAEPAMIVVAVVSIVLSAYVAWLSYQMIDVDQRTRLLVLAAGILIAGMVVLVSLIASVAIRKLFFKD